MPRELPGTEGAYAPFFSPDGQWVALFAQGKLKKISVEGGAAIDLCDAGTGVGGSWGEDGNMIAALSSSGGGLSRIPAAGGAPPLLDANGARRNHASLTADSARRHKTTSENSRTALRTVETSSYTYF